MWESGFFAARMAFCTAAFSRSTLHLLQRPLLHTRLPAPRYSAAAPCTFCRIHRGTRGAYNRIWKWERVHPLLHVRRSAPRHSAVARCTLHRIHHCTFYHVYRRTLQLQDGPKIPSVASTSCYFLLKMCGSHKCLSCESTLNNTALDLATPMIYYDRFMRISCIKSGWYLSVRFENVAGWVSQSRRFVIVSIKALRRW